MAQEIYKPGDIVPASGIYRVTHDKEHHQDHEVTVIRGRKFPPCNHCGDHPRFIPVRMAWHIDNHEQF
jgi:hypothetical protein